MISFGHLIGQFSRFEGTSSSLVHTLLCGKAKPAINWNHGRDAYRCCMIVRRFFFLFKGAGVGGGADAVRPPNFPVTSLIHCFAKISTEIFFCWLKYNAIPRREAMACFNKMLLQGMLTFLSTTLTGCIYRSRECELEQHLST